MTSSTSTHRHTANRPRIRTRIAAALFGSIGGLLIGCESAPKAESGERFDQMYASGRFAEAQDAASAVAKTASGSEQERAQLVAGMAARARDRDYEAEPLLRPLMNSDDPAVAARAKAEMGLIAQRSGNNSRAVELLTDAAGKFQGDQAARAMLYAGDSYRAMGQDSAARESYLKAASLNDDNAELKKLIDARLTPAKPVSAASAPARGGFALQLGAFSSRQRAQSVADKFRDSAARMGYGSPRVVDTTAKNKRVSVVQVGRFPSQQAAESARKAFGSSAIVTQAVDSPDMK